MLKYLYIVVIASFLGFCVYNDFGGWLYLLIGLASSLVLIPTNYGPYIEYCNKYNIKPTAINYILPFILDVVLWPIAVGSVALRNHFAE